MHIQILMLVVERFGCFFIICVLPPTAETDGLFNTDRLWSALVLECRLSFSSQVAIGFHHWENKSLLEGYSTTAVILPRPSDFQDKAEFVNR